MKEKRFPWNRVVIICAVVAGSIVWRYMGLPWGIPMVFALVGTAMFVAYVYHRIETRLMTTEELFEEHIRGNPVAKYHPSVPRRTWVTQQSFCE